MLLVFAVMADNLSRVPELIVKFLPKKRFGVCLCASRMQTIRNDKQNVLFLDPCSI